MPDLKLKPTFSCQSLMKGPIFLTDTRQTCKKRFSEKDIFSVKADTKTLVIALVKKLLLKAPIRYGLVRNMAWLHPLEICCDQERCLEHLGRCLRIVSDAPQIKLSSSGRNKLYFPLAEERKKWKMFSHTPLGPGPEGLFFESHAQCLSVAVLLSAIADVYF